MVNFACSKNCTPCDDNVQIRPYHFELCQWQRTDKPHIAYLLYRWAFALQFVIITLWSILDTRRYGPYYNYGKWFAYITNWSYTMCTLQAVIALYIVQKQWIYRNTYDGLRVVIPKLYKVYEILHSSSVAFSIGITFVYWTFIYDPIHSMHKIDAINILSHAFNTVLMVLDMFIVAHPCYLKHVMYQASIGATYIIFSLVHQFYGGTDSNGNHYVYPAMSWRENPGKAAIFSIMNIVIISIMHCIVYGLYLLRLWVTKSRFLSRSEPVSYCLTKSVENEEVNTYSNKNNTRTIII